MAKDRVQLHGSSKQPLSLSNPGGKRQSSREIPRDFIHAAPGLPALTVKTGIHVKTPHRIFGPKGNPTAANLFNIFACVQEREGCGCRQWRELLCYPRSQKQDLGHPE
ncbi:MAG: hypothetical protein ABR924_09360 [Terracidiphilus sp.]|jgi:hypothetical protein